MTTLSKTLIGAIATLSLILAPLFALADTVTTGVNAGVQAGVTSSTGGASVGANVKVSVAETRARTRGDMEIDRRIQNLNDVLTRAQDMKNLSAADKTAIQNTLTNQISVLTQLKAKIDADTDDATLKTDVQSVTGSYRIYALVLPQVRIIAAADRIVTLAGEMQLFSAKLQARISAAQVSGADMAAAGAAWADFNAKVADAHTQAQAAVTEIASLLPDQGDQTKLAANIVALKDARAKIVAAQHDLIAARADVMIIINAVKGKPVSANANASAASSTSGR